MALVYKMEMLPALKKAGYNTNRIRKEKLFGERTVQKFREHKALSFNELNKLCQLLNCQPGDLIAYVPDKQQDTEHDVG